MRLLVGFDVLSFGTLTINCHTFCPSVSAASESLYDSVRSIEMSYRGHRMKFVYRFSGRGACIIRVIFGNTLIYMMHFKSKENHCT